MEDIVIKTPIEKEMPLVMALKDILGIDAGTDAYYDDPDNFVSVIVRIPSKEDLQKIAEKVGGEIII